MAVILLFCLVSPLLRIPQHAADWVGTETSKIPTNVACFVSRLESRADEQR